jgi:hypothetical protein
MTTNRIRINTLAASAKLAAIYVQRQYVEAGGLMSYGTLLLCGRTPTGYTLASSRARPGVDPGSLEPFGPGRHLGAPQSRVTLAQPS